MRKAALIATLVVGMSTFGTAVAQDTGTDTGTDTGGNPGISQQDQLTPGDSNTTTDTGGGDNNMGLWGLAGLLGLAGLMGRSKTSGTTDYSARTQRGVNV